MGEASVILLLAPAAQAVTITFETRPDGTPIINKSGCGEIDVDTFRPWGVVFESADQAPLNIGTTLLMECGFSEPNALWHCPSIGTINITFVVPNTNINTVADRIRFSVFTATYAEWRAVINAYDPGGMLLDSWTFHSAGFCREPPFYVNGYEYAAPGRIARVECILLRVGIDDVVITESPTPVNGATWGRIKMIYR